MKQKRLNEIEKFIILNENVKIEDLCEKFSVSKNTIRRDLDEIVKRGKVAKIYGGVGIVKKDIMPIDEKINTNITQKNEIAKLATSFISDGDTIFVDSGSTTANIINFLATKSNITIISHSLNVIQEASKYKNLNIISLGGTYMHKTGAFLGFSALNMLDNMSINKIFMGCTGFSVENGASVNTLLEAEMKRKIVSRSKEVYLLCDFNKISVNATISYCETDKIKTIITNKKMSNEYEKTLKSMKVSFVYT